LVATTGDDIVGTADLLVVPNLTHSSRPWAIVENVIVDEAMRGRGAGRALFNEILAITVEARCYMVQLVSLNHRHEAHAFYARLGFSRWPRASATTSRGLGRRKPRTESPR
jgi:GNAT superfamily N-acetyltransferase